MQQLIGGAVAMAVGGSLVACGADGAGGGHRWEAAVDTIGDTVVVRTTSGSVWGDTATLVPEVRIGRFEGADEYLIGQVASLAVDGEGAIYVMDRQVPVLRKYAPDGTYLMDLGREGGGPGEYKRPDGGLAVLPDGRVVLRDPGNGRFNVYGPDGEALETWRLPGGGSFNTSRRLYADTAGNVYTLVLLQSGVDVTEWEYGLARYTRAGEHTDTLPAPTWDHERARVVGRSENSSSTSSVPFTPRGQWGYTPFNAMISALSTEYRIDLIRADGSVLRIEREWTPVPVRAEEAEERERRIRENFQRRFPGWKWNGPPIPETKPPYRGVIAGETGRLWVQVSQPGRPTMTAAEAEEEEERTGRPQTRFEEPVAFDVFDRDGRFLGHVRAPDGLSMYPRPVIRADTVWAVVQDELDVNYVVRFRVEHPARP